MSQSIPCRLRVASGISAHSRLALHVSATALAAALLLPGQAAFAQATPGTANANPTAPAQIDAVPTVAAPTLQPADAVPPAPQDDAAGGDEIVVTGIRAGLESSAKIKRQSVLIVDSISAEDVGKLPDVSIADSLACPA